MKMNKCLYISKFNLLGCRVRTEIQRNCLRNKATDSLLSPAEDLLLYNDLHEDPDCPEEFLIE
jgi:hypothetical protein